MGPQFIKKKTKFLDLTLYDFRNHPFPYLKNLEPNLNQIGFSLFFIKNREK